MKPARRSGSKDKMAFKGIRKARKTQDNKVTPTSA